MKVYSVYDSKAEFYSAPMFLRTKGEAIRAFTQEVQKPDSQLHKHPEDYILFELGEWDSDKGDLKGKTATAVIKAIECTREDAPQLQA